MRNLPAIFALLCGAAGWFYFLHASRAARLAHIEDARNNVLRIRLRRIGGILMFVLAVAFYASYALSQQRGHPVLVLTCMTVTLLLLPVILFLAWVDLRLTRKMRENMKERR